MQPIKIPTIPSKKNLKEFVKSIVDQVEQGNYDPIMISAKLDFISRSCDAAKDAIKEKTISELEKHASRKDFHGYLIEVVEAGIKYEYTRCGDSEILLLIRALEEIKERIKGRETFLKGIKERVEAVDPSTGEVIVLRPPSKKSTTTTKFTLK